MDRRQFIRGAAGFAGFAGLAGLAGCGAAAETGETTASEVIVDGAHVGGGGPGACVHDGKVFVTFTGTDKRINIAQWLPDNRFVIRTISDTAHGGSSLFSHNGDMHLVWVGTDWRINALKSKDGIHWTGRQQFGHPRYSADPALVLYEGFVNAFVAYVPRDGGLVDTGMHQFLLDGNGNWVLHGNYSNVRTQRSPSAAKLNNDLVVAWMGWDMEDVHFMKFELGRGWGAPVVKPWRVEGHLVSDGPGELLWVSRTGDNINIGTPFELNFASSTNGADFEEFATSQHKSKARPFVIHSNGEGDSLVAHVGTDKRLNVNQFNF